MVVPDGKLLPVGEAAPVAKITPLLKKAGAVYEVNLVVFPDPSTKFVFGAYVPKAAELPPGRYCQVFPDGASGSA